MTTRHGLVIGKFYPPHAGHHLLVRSAARQCDRLTVVVMAARVESISLERRVAWLQEVHASDANVTVTGIHDDNPVDLESDAVWCAHVALMREAAGRVTKEPVDVVFTSESYGEELGRRLRARHVAVDVARAAAPVSGTAVRANPPEHWSALESCVRGYLTWRVVLVGAESTGKTTLAAAIAERLRRRSGAWGNCEWVPEFGRDATLSKLEVASAKSGRPVEMEGLVWESADFVAIARAQADLEERAARRGGPLLVCDTDAFATGIWHERYMGIRSSEVEAIGDAAPYHHYLLTHPDDVPFVQDGVRDGERVRQWMTEVFVARLDSSGRRWSWLRGEYEERFEAALGIVDRVLASGWRLAPPLG